MYESTAVSFDAPMASMVAEQAVSARAPASASDPAPVDRAHLARYTLGDPALEKEVLGLFLAQFPLTVEALKFAATDKDWYMSAHALKGSARAVGAWELGQLAQEAEKLGRMAGGATTGIIARIEEAAARVEAYVVASFPGIER